MATFHEDNVQLKALFSQLNGLLNQWPLFQQNGINKAMLLVAIDSCSIIIAAARGVDNLDLEPKPICH